MKKFKRGKYLFGSLLVFAFVTTLLLNLKQENENLQKKNDELEQSLRELENIRTQNETLKELLRTKDIDQIKNYCYANMDQRTDEAMISTPHNWDFFSR